MSPETHSQLADFIWSICNLLRGPYKRNEYRKVILPLTVLRRFDCLLAPTKAEVLKKHAGIKTKPESVVRSLLQKTTGRPFYNLSKLDFSTFLNDHNQLAPNLNDYISKFSKNVRDIMDRFAFDQQIARMAEKNLLYEVIKAFARVDLSLNVWTTFKWAMSLKNSSGSAQSNRMRKRGALYPARGNQTDGQPASLTGERSSPQSRGEDHLRSCLWDGRDALRGREIYPRSQL